MSNSDKKEEKWKKNLSWQIIFREAELWSVSEGILHGIFFPPIL